MLVERMKSEVGRTTLNAGDLIVVGRRRRTADTMGRGSTEGYSGTIDAGQFQGLGEVAESILASGATGSVLVI